MDSDVSFTVNNVPAEVQDNSLARTIRSSTRRTLQTQQPSHPTFPSSPPPLPQLTSSKREWLLEDDEALVGEEDTFNHQPGVHDERAAGPEVGAILARLCLCIVRVTSVKQGPIPRFLACERCKSALEPHCALEHATYRTRGGCKHNRTQPMELSRTDRARVAEWIEKAQDLHSSSNPPLIPPYSPIPYPLERLEGFECVKATCSFITTSGPLMKAHTLECRSFGRWATVVKLYHNRKLYVVR